MTNYRKSHKNYTNDDLIKYAESLSQIEREKTLNIMKAEFIKNIGCERAFSIMRAELIKNIERERIIMIINEKAKDYDSLTVNNFVDDIEAAILKGESS